MAASPEMILDALRSVQDPDLHRDIVALGFVKDVAVDGGRASLTVELTTPACPVRDELEAQCREAVLGVPGVQEAEITMTARVREREQAESLIPGVRQTIAIASGKGGVGKSTATVNLAVALARQGARVGILDADVYGPSIPLMMGVAGERPLTRDQKIVPIERFGMKMMSLGFLLEDGQAVLWRGPMVAGTVKQLLGDVLWGELDYLLIDLPPGTGDAPMSLAQLVPLTGVVIVSTPHNVAANIAGKAAQLFRRLNSPILGVLENMGEFICPHCGEAAPLFTGERGSKLAERLGAPYLGSIPLDPAVGQAGDQGVPSVISHPERPQAEAFHKAAGELARQSSIRMIAQAAASAEFQPEPTD
jgi:ATP-binding protein involved in chromosome partitioning